VDHDIEEQVIIYKEFKCTSITVMQESSITSILLNRFEGLPTICLEACLKVWHVSHMIARWSPLILLTIKKKWALNKRPRYARNAGWFPTLLPTRRGIKKHTWSKTPIKFSTPTTTVENVAYAFEDLLNLIIL